MAIRSGEGGKTMENPTSNIMAWPIVRTASSFQAQRMDRVPHSVAIDLGDDTLVITLEEVHSPAEKALPGAGADAAHVQEAYRQFIAGALSSMRQHLKGLAEEIVPEAAHVIPRIRSGRPRGWDRRR